MIRPGDTVNCDCILRIMERLGLDIDAREWKSIAKTLLVSLHITESNVCLTN